MAPQARILMVEDNPDLVDLYRLKLQLEGYRVAVAADGAAGLELARSLRPDAILLDVHMPRLDGLQMLAALRADEATRAVPVVMFSDDDSQEVIAEARRLSAAAYLVKSRLLPSGVSQAIAAVLRETVEPSQAAAVKAS
ncbi:MAG TPA: response regulator [Candidatus Dormibacteraeota bacterium]|jgi:DNA-binding response OmpR family regulator